MKACKAVLSQSQATEQLEEEFVNNLHCTAQSFSCIKARWFPVPQVREAAMPAGRSQMGLTAAWLEWMQEWGDASIRILLWASSIPAAMGRWGRVLSCPLLIRGVHSSKEKRQKPSTPCLSLSYHELPACGWAGSILNSPGQWSIAEWSCCPPFRHLHGQGISRNVYCPFYFRAIKATMASARLFMLVFLDSDPLHPTPEYWMVNQECAVFPLLCFWGFLTHGARSLRSPGLISTIKVRWMWNLNPHEYHYATEFSQILHAGTFSGLLQGYSSWKIK